MRAKRACFYGVSAIAAIGVAVVLVACAPDAQYAGDGSGQSDASAPAPRPSSPSTASAPAAAPILGAQSKSARPDPRDGRRARSRALVATELNGLEALAAQTPTKAPDHPQLLRRIAEDYVELEHGAHAEGLTAAEFTAQAKAIQAYSQLLLDHPDYAQKDEALFYLALEYEAAGDKAHARKSYFELIKEAPQSRFVPNAYLAFGEMFFDEAANDPKKYGLAEQGYREVVKFPPPGNGVYGYAYYKLGWTLFNEGKADEAADAFKKVLDYVTEFPDAVGARQLSEAARKDLATLQSSQSQ